MCSHFLKTGSRGSCGYTGVSRRHSNYFVLAAHSCHALKFVHVIVHAKTRPAYFESMVLDHLPTQNRELLDFYAYNLFSFLIYCDLLCTNRPLAIPFHF
jgi:hypothetical protein